MSDLQPKNSIQKSVLEKIRVGEVHRHSKAYFLARVVTSLLVTLLLFATSAFVISFVLFSLHESGEQFLLGFGVQGILVFLRLFPWASLMLDIGLVFLLEWLVRGFKFGYRIPLLNIFFGLFGASVVVGLLVTFTPLHALLLSHATRGDLPFNGGPYEHVLDIHEEQGIFRGIVTSASSSSFVITHNDYDQDKDDGTYTVVPMPGSNFLVPAVGDRVFVFGHIDQGSITASNMQVLSPLLSE